MGLLTPIGNDLSSIRAAIHEGRSGVRVHPELGEYDFVHTRLAGSVVTKKEFPRRMVRTMGRVGKLALEATEAAIEHAGWQREWCGDPKTGLAYGSTHGSSSELLNYCETIIKERSFEHVSSTSYLKFMSHTCAANLAQVYGVQGRVLSTNAACVSSSQAVGFAYELIRDGVMDRMIAGGAEELHITHVAVFDGMMATSTKTECSPRPFDASRDGLVVSEGACTILLEDHELAVKRGANIFAEIIGFGSNCDGDHVTAPSVNGMKRCMQLALLDAQMTQVDYVNAHATGTDIGDERESHAILEVLGQDIPVSSLKGHMGHTLGACGAIEVAMCVDMLREGYLAPTLNLEQVDQKCARLQYVKDVMPSSSRVMLSNNFAFGGMNTSLVISKV